jgi:serine/threonine protein kinase
MRRELDVWKNLDHPHIIRLYGTTSDFGPYSSMVCPWLEHGSVSKYMERCGDLVSTADRLQLVSHSVTLLEMSIVLTSMFFSSAKWLMG